MTRPTDEELDALVEYLRGKGFINQREADAITTLRTQIAEANARADRAEAALAASQPADPVTNAGCCQPVAWQYRYRAIGKEVGKWSDWNDGKAPDLRTSTYDFEERPLFAAIEPVPVTLADALQVPEVRALVEAADYVTDGMGISYPGYEVDGDEDYLDAANAEWVRDTLIRLAAALRRHRGGRVKPRR